MACFNFVSSGKMRIEGIKNDRKFKREGNMCSQKKQILWTISCILGALFHVEGTNN